jgi:hypothetical protein
MCLKGGHLVRQLYHAAGGCSHVLSSMPSASAKPSKDFIVDYDGQLVLLPDTWHGTAVHVFPDSCTQPPLPG